MTDGGGAVPAGNVDVETILLEGRQHVDAALERTLPLESEPPETLHRAMRYSVFAGGKRLRPVLLLAAGRACGGDEAELLPAACAIEMIHTYSLIHDDLPAFDDDDVRRGHSTNHRVFGEAMAILAGDALQTRAFELLAGAGKASSSPQRWAAAAEELGHAAGSRGMAGGQCADVEAEGNEIDLPAVRDLHAAKTGALITAAVRMGGLITGCGPDELAGLTRYGRAVGLAFQIIDDVLDVEGSLAELGKHPGGDHDRGKPTYPALLGVDGARQRADALCDEGLAALSPFGGAAGDLAALARFVVERAR